MANLKGITSGALGASSLGVGGYGFTQFQQGGIVNQAQGVGITAAGMGLGIGAGKMAMASRRPSSFDSKISYATSEAAKQASKGLSRSRLGIGLLAGGSAIAAKGGLDFSQGEYQNSMVLRWHRGIYCSWWRGSFKVWKIRQGQVESYRSIC